jgi:hypothetical protein
MLDSDVAFPEKYPAEKFPENFPEIFRNGKIYIKWKTI